MGFNVGQRLKDLREYLGLTQEVVSEIAGVDPKHYGRIERNETVPSIKMVEKICRSLDITLVHFFMPTSKAFKNDFATEFKIQKTKDINRKNDIDIHFNQNILFPGCESCIWYNGYLASAFFDEYELRLNAEGNIRARIFINYEEVETINEEDASNELLKYAKNDRQLNDLLVYEEVNEATLLEKKGNAIFLQEANWLVLVLSNHITGELIDEFELDTENVFEPFLGNGSELIDYFWG